MNQISADRQANVKLPVHRAGLAELVPSKVRVQQPTSQWENGNMEHWKIALRKRYSRFQHRAIIPYISLFQDSLD